MTADQHRAEAQRKLDRAYVADREDVVGQAVMGLISAVLAVEARLGELVDAQHTATLLAGSAYGLIDPGLVRRLVDAIGDAMTDVPVTEQGES